MWWDESRNGKLTRTSTVADSDVINVPFEAIFILTCSAFPGAVLLSTI